MSFADLNTMDQLRVIYHHLPTNAHIEVQKRVAVVLIEVYRRVNPLVNSDLQVSGTRGEELAQELLNIIHPHKRKLK